jgi:ribose 5-phosphate isomerase B
MIINIFMLLYNTVCGVFSKYNHKSLIFRLSLYPLNIILFMPSIVLVFDHAGFIFRWPITHFLESAWYTILDVWPAKIDEQDDFPDYAESACQKILDWEAERWVLICGTGIGMSIAANRHIWIRAVLAYNPAIAKISRTHNDANVICFGARTMELATVLASLEVFLTTDFLWAKYQRRNEKLDS